MQPFGTEVQLLSSFDTTQLRQELELAEPICAAFQQAVVSVFPQARASLKHMGMSSGLGLSLSVVEEDRAHLFSLANWEGIAYATGHGFPSTNGRYPLLFSLVVAETVQSGASMAPFEQPYEVVPLANFGSILRHKVAQSLRAPSAARALKRQQSWLWRILPGRK